MKTNIEEPFINPICYTINNMLQRDEGSLIKKNVNIDNTCKHANKYRNIYSKTLKFWVCKDCGEDLGDC